MNKKITYKDAGVDIKKADEAIEMSKIIVGNTQKLTISFIKCTSRCLQHQIHQHN